MVSVGKLIEWREVFTANGLHHRAKEVQKLIDDLKKG